MIQSCRPVHFGGVGDQKGFVVADRWSALKSPVSDQRRTTWGNGDTWGWTASSHSMKNHSSEELSVYNQPVSEAYLLDLRHDLAKLCELDPHDVFPLAKNVLRHEIERTTTILQRQIAESNRLPPPIGPVVKLVEKLLVPVDEFPDYNFAGRILGPRGMTVKQLEQETGCKIMVKGRSAAEKLQPDVQLHVVITAEDARNRAEVKLRRGVAEVSKLLRPNPDGTDELKRKQLMEVAIINGTYRPPSHTRSPVSYMTTYMIGSQSPTAVVVPRESVSREFRPTHRQSLSPQPLQIRSQQPGKVMSAKCEGLLNQLGIDLRF